MAAQTTLNGPGSQPESPPRAFRRSLGDFTHDVVVLAELQVALLEADMRSAGGRLIAPLALAVLGVCVGLACFPIFLMSLGYLLERWLSAPLAFLLAALVGVALAGGLLWAAWRWGRKSLHVLDRSRTELRENVRWLKAVLKRKGQDLDGRCP